MPRRYRTYYPSTYAERKVYTTDKEEALLRGHQVEKETDPEKLKEYANDRWSNVRLATARSIHSFPETVDYLTCDVRDEVVHAAYANVLCSRTALLAGATRKHMLEEHLMQIARHPNRDEEIVDALSYRRPRGVSFLVASDSYTSVPRIRHYLKSKRPEVVAAALSNEQLPEAAELVRTASEPVLYSLLTGLHLRGIWRLTLSPQIIEEYTQLAFTVNSSLAVALSGHPQGTGEINDRLMRNPVSSGNPAVKRCVADSSNTWGTTLITLCIDPDPLIRSIALGNPNCPDEGHVAAALLRS